MKRPLQALLAVQILLSAAAGASVCASCGTGRLMPALLGMLGYAVLFGRALTAGLSRDVFVGILFAGGIHAALVAKMLTTGDWCVFCAAATLVSVAMMGMVVHMDRSNLGRLAVLTPTAALLVLAGGSSPLVAALPATDGRVAILAYTQPDCEYCEELKKAVLPDIEREFGDRIRIELHSADELPAIRRTPTLILSSGRSSTRTRVIEGLPTVERLRGVVRDLETGP